MKKVAWGIILILFSILAGYGIIKLKLWEDQSSSVLWYHGMPTYTLTGGPDFGGVLILLFPLMVLIIGLIILNVGLKEMRKSRGK